MMIQKQSVLSKIVFKFKIDFEFPRLKLLRRFRLKKDLKHRFPKNILLIDNNPIRFGLLKIHN